MWQVNSLLILNEIFCKEFVKKFIVGHPSGMMVVMIDEKGYRRNVGIILTNQEGKLFFARRVSPEDAWQFPQGGIQEDEDPETAMFRELYEEVGLQANDVDIMTVSNRWLYYHLPKNLRRFNSKPLCIGQKQKWFLLRLTSEDSQICLDRVEKPEFDHWQWVDYWYPVNKVILFKRLVYRKVLKEFEPLMIGGANSE